MATTKQTIKTAGLLKMRKIFEPRPPLVLLCAMDGSRCTQNGNVNSISAPNT